MAQEVFISYASPDSEVVFDICKFLEQSGISCWIAPRNVRLAIPYAMSLIEGIDQAKMMLLILSQNANGSKHIPKEVGLAMDRGIPILPFRIENTEPQGGLKYFLQEIQRLDGFPSPVDQHLPTLVSAVREVMERGSTSIGKTPGGPLPLLPPRARSRPKRPGILLRVLYGLGCMLRALRVRHVNPAGNAAQAAKKEELRRKEERARASVSADKQRKAAEKEAKRVADARKDSARAAARQQETYLRQREADRQRNRSLYKGRLRQLYGALDELVAKRDWNAARPFVNEIFKIDPIDPKAQSANQQIEAARRVLGQNRR